ncbi:MAG: hypothetical protein HC910_06435 [Spirulinaceae cyanobacterium SM2_1_0]|nr:hypothetical protein [Spirulinaceae cyanobacterium SM2_1_0]
MNLTGRIEHRDLGTGAWVLVTDAGETYELRQAPAALKQAGQRVQVTGEIQENVMTLAMSGPVLAVQSFEPLAD